jgi:hypothetical protein
LGLQLDVYETSSEGEIEKAFAAIAGRGTVSLLVTTDPFFFRQQYNWLGWQHTTRCLPHILPASSQWLVV